MSPDDPPVGAAVPLVMFGIVGLPLRSEYAPLVATAARPLTADAEIVAAVVRTPLAVVTTIWPLVEPMAPAVVILPWVWLDAAASVIPYPVSVVGVAVIVDHVWVWAVGVLASESRESLPTQTVEAVVPVVMPSTADELVPLLVIGAVTEITPDDPAAPAAPVAPAAPAAPLGDRDIQHRGRARPDVGDGRGATSRSCGHGADGHRGSGPSRSGRACGTLGALRASRAGRASRPCVTSRDGEVQGGCRGGASVDHASRCPCRSGCDRADGDRGGRAVGTSRPSHTRGAGRAGCTLGAGRPRRAAHGSDVRPCRPVPLRPVAGEIAGGRAGRQRIGQGVDPAGDRRCRRGPGGREPLEKRRCPSGAGAVAHRDDDRVIGDRNGNVTHGVTSMNPSRNVLVTPAGLTQVIRSP